MKKFWSRDLRQRIHLLALVEALYSRAARWHVGRDRFKRRRSIDHEATAWVLLVASFVCLAWRNLSRVQCMFMTYLYRTCARTLLHACVFNELFWFFRSVLIWFTFKLLFDLNLVFTNFPRTMEMLSKIPIVVQSLTNSCDNIDPATLRIRWVKWFL